MSREACFGCPLFDRKLKCDPRSRYYVRFDYFSRGPRLENDCRNDIFDFAAYCLKKGIRLCSSRASRGRRRVPPAWQRCAGTRLGNASTAGPGRARGPAGLGTLATSRRSRWFVVDRCTAGLCQRVDSTRAENG